MDVAHAQNIVHRDLKPSNIMFDQNRTAYLTDFGIAKVLDSTMKVTAKSMVVGTPYYMSPEQFSDEWEIGGYSDQYSLAVVVFEVLSGKVPFEGANTAQVMYKHLSKTPPQIHEIKPKYNPAVSNVLQQALNKKPHERYGSVLEFVEALQEAILMGPAPSNQTNKGPVPGNINATILSKPGNIDATVLSSPEKDELTSPSQPENIDMTMLSKPGGINETILSNPSETKTPPKSPAPRQPKVEDPPLISPDEPKEIPSPTFEEPVNTPPPAPSKEELEVHYQEGLRALHREDWETAVKAFTIVTKADPSYRSARILQNQADRELNRSRYRRPTRGDLNVESKSAAEETFLLDPVENPVTKQNVSVVPGAGGTVTKPSRRSFLSENSLLSATLRNRTSSLPS
jgi:serine/threonine protein kinase